MYDSGITAESLVAMVQAEADISITIPTDSWYRWINETEQTLYTEIIKEYKSAKITSPTSPVAMTSIAPAATENQAIFEDIYKVYADGKELQKAKSLISGLSFKGYKSVWYKENDGIGFSLANNDTAAELTVIYAVRPALKAVADETHPSTDICLPIEFVELMACRLRGEAYKLANDDGQSGKWLADYNGYVENFKVWVKSHGAGYGE